MSIWARRKANAVVFIKSSETGKIAAVGVIQ